jgi:uncharacterized protein YbaP (TraB family)
MKIRLPPLALSLTLLASFAASADSGAQRPLLWKVSDADNSVYLLGSFHLLKSDDYPLPKEIDAAFDDAKSLLFEVAPEELKSPQLPALAQKYAAYEDGQSLSKVLPKATLEKLDAMAKVGGGSVQAMEQTEPWAMYAGMVMGLSQALGYRQELGLDAHLMERAAKAGKSTAGLETMEAQLKAMDTVPYAEQALEIDEFLGNPQQLIQELTETHTAWRSGDAATLDTKMRAEMAQKTPESYRLLNLDRNLRWLPLVEQRLTASKSDNTLVVVGALHLLGADGLMEQLRARGYKVERLCDSCME